MQVFERPLLDAERRWLRQAIERPRVAGRKLALAMIIPGLVVCGPLAALTMAASRVDWRVVLAVWTCIGIFIGLWAYFQARWRMARSVRRYVFALERNKARVTQIQSSAVVEIEEKDDEGKAYAFQLPEGRIVFVIGQDFYTSARFPNTDFTIVEILGNLDVVVGTLIEKRGEKLVPLKKLSPKKARKLDWPCHLQVIDGSLSELENLLAN